MGVNLTKTHTDLGEKSFGNDRWIHTTCALLLIVGFIGHQYAKLFTEIPKLLSKRLQAWSYLLNGASVIQSGFDKANGQPYEVMAPDARYIFVSSENHIKEIDNAPDTVLSLQAASKQMLQPMYTMSGFNWFDRRGTEGIGFVRTLRTLLTNNLPSILPDLEVLIRVRFQEMYAESNNEAFMLAARMYVEETLIGAEIVKLMPKSLSSLVGVLLSRRLKSQQAIFDALLPVAQQRCQERDMAFLGHKVPKHVIEPLLEPNDHADRFQADCIQWIMETAPRQKPWTPQRVVHELMAIWFGSVHALSTTITFAIQDLCLHPEYTKPLREEIKHHYKEFEKSASGLPLLGSFLKESARLTPVESMSTRRCATKPFTLSDGTSLAVGDWACTPVRAIMTSPSYYPEALTFHGFRFVDPAIASQEVKQKFALLQPQPSKLTDASQAWHVWGTGRMVCPGRFYATSVMKLVVGHIIMNYDCQLADSSAGRWMTWRSTMLPKQETIVLFMSGDKVT